MSLLHPAQVAAYRRMSPAEELKTACGLWRAARALRAAALRLEHPDWTEEAVQAEVRKVFLRART
jgi:hypothetical protein